FVDYLGDLMVRFYRFIVSYAKGWMHREHAAGKANNYDEVDAHFEDDIKEQIELPTSAKKAEKQKAINKPQTPFNEPQI
ncbi:hypothetical protein, partial [Pseudoalteromonas sp. 24-MNA-CIBAN-0067]